MPMQPRPMHDTASPPSFRRFIPLRLHYNSRRIGLMARTIGLIVLAAAAAVAAQEHSYTQADIENGARLYQSSCAGCHGPNGDMVPGIELHRGQFRRATNDTEIMRIIQSGIPGTTMEPGTSSDAAAGA